MYSFYFSLRGNKNVPIQVIYIFGGIGLLAFASSYFLQSLSGLILFLSYPILFFLIKQHLQIDFATKMCRLGIDFMGFTFGKWKPLPTIEYISVFRKQYRKSTSNKILEFIIKFEFPDFSLLGEKFGVF